MQPTIITIDTADPTVSQAVARIARAFAMEPDVAEAAFARFLVNVVDEILLDPEWHCDDRQSNHRHDWKRIADIATGEKRHRRGLWASAERPSALPLTRGEIALKIGELVAAGHVAIHPSHTEQLCIALVAHDAALADWYLAYKRIAGSDRRLAYLVAPAGLERALESRDRRPIDLVGRVVNDAPRALRGPTCTMSDPCDAHDPCPDHVEEAARFLGTQVPALGDAALASAALPADLEF